MTEMIHCRSCHNPYPKESTPFCCQECGGLFDFTLWPVYNPKLVSNEQNIWRYRHAFGLPEESPRITLGEGDTPLIWVNIEDREVGLKLDFLNPTCSFKDRGTALLISFLVSRGVKKAADDSSGNAGASFAAYSAKAGIKATVFVPVYASGPKFGQIHAYGAEVIPVTGSRSDTREAVCEAAALGMVYASHSMLPHGIPGFATTAYEIVDQIGGVPGTVIAPAGQGTQLLALGRAFCSMRNQGMIEVTPQLIGVQAKACAPFYLASTSGMDSLENMNEGETLAEGVRIKMPNRLNEVLEIVHRTGGRFVVVDEEEILSGQRSLAEKGVFVEPTTAIVWNGLLQVIHDAPEPIILILTGSGLKSI